MSILLSKNRNRLYFENEVKFVAVMLKLVGPFVAMFWLWVPYILYSLYLNEELYMTWIFVSATGEAALAHGFMTYMILNSEN